MPPPRVSIILPAYDAAEALPAALASIRAQTFSDFEVIVVDDGSRDATLHVATSSALGDPRIRVAPSDHAGIVRALQRGCSMAQAPILARMDADDVMHPERLARQVAYLDAHAEAALIGTQVRMTGAAIGKGRRRYEAWINALTTPEEIAREIYVECPLPHPAFMMRRIPFEAVGGYQDHGWAEDYDLVLRMHAAGYELGKVDAVLLDWRESPGRLSRTSARYSDAQFRACKRFYLAQGPLAGGRRFMQWGAGEVGKRWLREWGEAPPEAVVDINPRKIGRTIHGVPVIAPEDLPPPGDVVLLAAVGAPGAREDIRAWLDPRGYAEGRDYWFVA